MRASSQEAAANQVIERIELPSARPHSVQEDVRILDDFESRIDAPYFAWIVHRTREGRAELSMGGTPGDDLGAERTRVVESDLEVRASCVGGLCLRKE
jgi:hypothetical protein